MSTKSKTMIKQWLVSGALLTLALAPTAASAASAEASAQAAPKDVASNVAGYLKWNTPVTIKLGSASVPVQGEMINTEIMVPLRAVVEAKGGSVVWDEETRTAHAVVGGVNVVQTLGEAEVTIDGRSWELDHEAELIGGVMMVSERLLPLALDVSLHWDSASRTLSLSDQHGAGGLEVHSDAFERYGNIPAKYAHGGSSGERDMSLPVSWSHAPEGTKSFAVVMYDLHPIADNYIHWSVLNLPTDTQALAEGAAGSLKEGVEVNSYFGMGPPPHSGDHLYRLVVYALDTEKLDIGATPVFFEELEPALSSHMLGYAEVDGFFKQ